MACFGCPLLIVNDRGPENQPLTKELFERFNVGNVHDTVYHPQLNGLVERGYQNIVNALAKLTALSGKPGNWPAHLASASWADRIMVHKSTGMTPYRAGFGQEFLLPVSIAMESWRVVDWLYYGPQALYTFPTSTYHTSLNPLPYIPHPVHVPLFKSPRLTLIT